MMSLSKPLPGNVLHLCNGGGGAGGIIGRSNNIHLMSDQLVLFSRDDVEGNIRTRGKTKLTGFRRDLTLSVLLYS